MPPLGSGDALVSRTSSATRIAGVTSLTTLSAKRGKLPKVSWPLEERMSAIEFCGGPWDGIMREVGRGEVPAVRVILSPAVVGVAWTYRHAENAIGTIRPFILSSADQSRWYALSPRHRARIQALSRASVPPAVVLG